MCVWECVFVIISKPQECVCTHVCVRACVFIVTGLSCHTCPGTKMEHTSQWDSDTHTHTHTHTYTHTHTHTHTSLRERHRQHTDKHTPARTHCHRHTKSHTAPNPSLTSETASDLHRQSPRGQTDTHYKGAQPW